MTTVQLSLKHLQEIQELDPMLLQIFYSMISLWTSDTCSVTSIHRPVAHDMKIKGKTLAEYKRGVHTVGPPYRAIDTGVFSLGHKWPKEVKRIAEVLNDMYVYDPMRPDKVVCYVKPHGTGPHIHLQVHPSTRRRK